MMAESDLLTDANLNSFLFRRFVINTIPVSNLADYSSKSSSQVLILQVISLA